MKRMQTFKQSSLLLLLATLSISLTACLPEGRGQLGVVDNGGGTRSGGRGVTIGGDALDATGGGAANPAGTVPSGRTGPNGTTVAPNDPSNPNQPQQNNGLSFTKRKDELWRIACNNATEGDIGIKIPDPNDDTKEILSTVPIYASQGPDADNDGISDKCERFLFINPAFVGTNPQLMNGYMVSAVKLSPSVLKQIARDAANVKANSSIKDAKKWEKTYADWNKDDSWIMRRLNRSDNTRLWLGRAFCALSQSGRTDSSQQPNISDSGGIVRTIYQEHMKKPELRMEMESDRTLSKKIYGRSNADDRTLENFAVVEGGLQNALIHNAFFDQNQYQLNGPLDIYTGEDQDNDIMYVAEAMIETNKAMDVKLVHLNELGQITEGNVKEAFLMTLAGDTKISSIDLGGGFDFVLNRPGIAGGVNLKDCLNDEKRLATTIPNTNGRRKHFTLASFYLGKNSRDTFFRENLMVQYTDVPKYISSKDGSDNIAAGSKQRFTEHEEVPAEQADSVYEFLPQNIATITDNDPKHHHRVLMPYMPEDLSHIAQYRDLSANAYWTQHAADGLAPDELLLADPIEPDSGTNLEFPGFDKDPTTVAINSFLDPDGSDDAIVSLDPSSVGTDVYAGESTDAATVDDEDIYLSEEEKYAAEEARGVGDV